MSATPRHSRERSAPARDRAGFTMVELIVVVVISAIAMTAVYQSLITQQKTYRRQNAAIAAQGTERMALQVLAGELREISTVGGQDVAASLGSDLLVAGDDSIQFRAFRKMGIVCATDVPGNSIDVWALGESFAKGDSLLLFQEGDSTTTADDGWAKVVVGSTGSPKSATCATTWSEYTPQGLGGLGSSVIDSVTEGGIVRSYETVTYLPYKRGSDWVIGVRTSDGLVPLVGPIMDPDSGGIVFTYYDQNGTQLTPYTQAELAKVARVNIQVKALSRGGSATVGDYVDSLTTNVYLRGN